MAGRKTLVFYAGLLYGEYPSWKEFKDEVFADNPEIWQGAYLFHYTTVGYGWYRSDGVPVLDQHVPKELKVLALLLQ
jgi:hypothetical protein